MSEKLCKCGKPINPNRFDHMGKPLSVCDECFKKSLKNIGAINGKDKK